MKILRLWNKITDVLLDFLKIITFLLIIYSVVMIIVSIFKEVDTYKYCALLAVLTYTNNKLNGG